MKIRKLIISLVCVLMTLGATNLALAKGGELKFHSIVIAVSQTDSNAGSIDVTVHDVVVPIIVNGDTEIEESGEEIGLVDISAGDFVKVTAFFSDEGLVADEIEILEVRHEQFRFRGAISAVDMISETTVITLLGVDVNVGEDTDITRRGSGRGKDVPASDLAVGDQVNVSGGVEDGLLVAHRIHVGNREQGEIELEGEIESLGDSTLTMVIENGASVTVTMDENTSVVGDLAEGVFIEVEGQLLEDLSLIAFEIVVDVDGDGDADDDNHRGRRGHHDKDDDDKDDDEDNDGTDDDNDDGNDDGDDDGDDDASDDDFSNEIVEVSAETALGRDDMEIHGRAEFRYIEEGDIIEQKFEVSLEEAEAETEYEVLVFFGDIAVSFGLAATNELGNAEFEIESDDEDASLTELLPEGTDVRDITGVQILLGDSVILEGDF